MGAGQASIINSALGGGGSGTAAPTRSQRSAQRNGTVSRAGRDCDRTRAPNSHHTPRRYAARSPLTVESVERVKLSERTLTDLDALLARLAEVRARGYAVSDGENAFGLITVAAPVLDVRGVPCAGVSLTVGGARLSVAEFTAAAAPQAQRIAAELGEGVRLSLGAVGIPGGRAPR